MLRLISVFALIISFQFVSPVFAGMSSSSYKILNDVTGCGGGKSTSTNYILFDTLCDNAAGDGTSTSYVMQGGFEASQDLPFITASISPTSISLGTLSSTAVQSDSVVVTVTTNALSGYSTSIITDGNFRTGGGNSMTNADDTDTVSVGSGKYGVCATGSDGVASYLCSAASSTRITGISATAKVIASHSGPTEAVNTTITFKAAAAESTVAGSYSQTVTLITTGTF